MSGVRKKNTEAGIAQATSHVADFGLGRAVRSRDTDNPMIVEYETSGKIVAFNKRAREFFGYSAKEVLGKDISILVYGQRRPDDAKKGVAGIHQDIFNDPADGGAHINLNKLRGGQRVWVSWRSRPIAFKNGKPAVMAAAGHDVTYQIERDDSLRDLKKIIASVNDGVEIADRDGILIFVNEQAARIIGYHPKEVMGKRITDFVADEDKKVIEKAFTKRREGYAVRHELRMKHRDGSIIETSFFSAPRYSRKGSYIGSYTIISDITERNRNEENLRRMNRTLRALGRVNKALLRAGDEKKLLQDVCEIIVEECGNSMVWIGFARDDERKSVDVAAQIGMARNYLETINISWGDNDRGRSPMGACIRTGEMRICRNVKKDPNFSLWRPIAERYGYEAAAAFPLRSDGNTFGAIGIYSRNEDGLSEDETALLGDLADNLAYGIVSLRLRNERHQNEVMLHKAIRYLDSLLSYAYSPIIVWGPDFRITRFNTAAERLTGMKAPQVLGRDVDIFFSCVEAGRQRGSFKTVPSGQRWKTIEADFCRADGSKRTVVWNLANIYGYGNEADKVVATIALGQDITDRKIAQDQAEKYLSELSREKKRIENLMLRIADEKKMLDGIIENNEALIAYLDNRFNFVKANTGYCREYNLTPKEMIGKNYFSFFADSEDEVKAILKKLRQDGVAIKRLAMPYYNERHPERGVTYRDLMASPIKDAAENVSGIVLLYLDATQRVRDEKTLALHSKRLQQMVNDLRKLQMAVENASDIIFIADPQGTITSINNAVLSILGRRSQELIGKSVTILGGAERCQEHSAVWKSICKQKKIFSGEITNARIDGRTADFELRVSPVIDARGEVISYIGIERDLSEAKAVSRAKEEFISMASHQLRTPLATISLSAQMLANGAIGNVDNEARGQIEGIFRITHEMASLVNLFLNASRIEMGRLDIDPHPVEVEQFLCETIKPIGPLAAVKKIELKSNIAPDMPVLNIDRKVMNMVLENLLTNALKYTPSGGVITLSAKKQGQEVIFGVTDTGRGIPKKQFHLLFSKMFRASNVGDASGYGLGLSMSKNVVEQSGGRIWAQTKLNQGSTFFVAIPVSGMKRRKITFES